ncbi:MAG: polysaccharide biosynthesis protein [Prevotella sp.]|nr:polysaccharide biosynthesis protein [Prevotella sp.]
MINNQPTVQDTFSKSKRIASNTVVLFVRMFILTILNLYAVRLVLNGLGEQDYGIFNTVAGVVTLSSFVSGVMALSIQRFYSIALGKNDYHRLKEIFSTSVNILVVFSLILLVVFETVGLWFVQTRIHIPMERMNAALWIYQFALFSFICSIFQIPYSAAMFAHEDMGTYAFISTMECILRVFVAFLIGKMIIDGLTFYGLGLLVVAILVLLMYIWFASKNYKECHYQYVKQSPLYKRLLVFSGWTMFGSLANVGLIQGSIILLSMFFSPVVNAAFGIALQINIAFQALCNSIVMPFRPAMIKAYAEKQFDYLNQLFSVCNKFILYALIAVGLPLIFEMRFVLSLWLGGQVNDNMVLFSRLIIIYIVCLAMNNPITIIMEASGYVKEYHLFVDGTMLFCLPISWLLLHRGLPPYSVVCSMIGVCGVAHIIRLLCLRHFYKSLSMMEYFVFLVIPGLLIALIGAAFSFLLHLGIVDEWLRFITVVILLPLTIVFLSFFIGMNRKERSLAKCFVKSFRKQKNDTEPLR